MCGEQNKNERSYTSDTKIFSNYFHNLQLACHSHRDKQTKKVWLPQQGSRTSNCTLQFSEPKRHTINAYDSIYNPTKRGSKRNVLDQVKSSDATPPALSNRVPTERLGDRRARKPYWHLSLQRPRAKTHWRLKIY